MKNSRFLFYMLIGALLCGVWSLVLTLFGYGLNDIAWSTKTLISGTAMAVFAIVLSIGIAYTYKNEQVSRIASWYLLIWSLTYIASAFLADTYVIALQTLVIIFNFMVIVKIRKNVLTK